MKIAILIPARLGSTRFPNKPLADIKGKTMIERVCLQAKQTNHELIYVACSELETKNIVEKSGFKAVMTDPDLPSGTDRIYQALLKIEKEQEVDVIVNLQGDLPDIKPEVISKTVNALINNKGFDIATAVVEIKEKHLEDDPNVVKAVVNFSNKAEFAEAHYFSRAKVPYNAPKFYEHIGIYAYHRDAIGKFVNLAESNLEKAEKLEQLRAIDNGMKIIATLVPYEQKPISIDTKEDLELLLRKIS